MSNHNGKVVYVIRLTKERRSLSSRRNARDLESCRNFRLSELPPNTLDGSLTENNALFGEWTPLDFGRMLGVNEVFPEKQPGSPEIGGSPQRGEVTPRNLEAQQEELQWAS